MKTRSVGGLERVAIRENQGVFDWPFSTGQRDSPTCSWHSESSWRQGLCKRGGNKRTPDRRLEWKTQIGPFLRCRPWHQRHQQGGNKTEWGPPPASCWSPLVSAHLWTLQSSPLVKPDHKQALQLYSAKSVCSRSSMDNHQGITKRSPHQSFKIK